MSGVPDVVLTVRDSAPVVWLTEQSTWPSLGNHEIAPRADPGSTGFREESDTRLAFSGGGGLQFAVAATKVFVGAQFMSDADAGVLAVHAGVAFPGRAR